jgi:hypothetical protein
MSEESEKMFDPAPTSEYEHLTQGGSYKVDLSQVEAAVLLKAHDYGVKALNDDDLEKLDIVVSKLKDKIWP